MRTIRATLVGGRSDGIHLHPNAGAKFVDMDDERYFRTQRRDEENRQVFQVAHPRTLRGLKPCDLG